MSVTIDARAVMRATGVSPGTLHVWIGRGLIPGVEPGTQGHARAFDLDTVLHIAAMSLLVQVHHPAPFASMAAHQARGRFDSPGAKLLIAPRPMLTPGLDPLKATPRITVEELRSPEELCDFIDRFNPGPPELVTILDLNRIYARIRSFVMEPDAMEKARRAGVMTASEKRRYERSEE